MRQMKDSGIPWVGEIPSTWELKKIKYVLRDRVEKNTPVRTTNILSLTAKQGVIPLDEREGGGNKPKEDFSAYHIAYPGDIVMNSMNILSGSVGLSKYYGCVSPVYYMLRPFNEKEDVRFYNYIFQTTVFQKSLFGLGNGILIKESGNGKLNTIRMRIPMEKLGRLLIPIAPMNEQKILSDYLDAKCAEIDALSADVQSEIELLESYKRSVITEAVTKGLDKNAVIKDSGIPWVGEIPETWETIDVKYLFEIVKRIAGKEGYDVLSITNRGITIKDISNNEGQIASDYKKYQFVFPGDFAMNCLDLNAGWIDISSLFGVTSPDYRVFRLRDSLTNHREYYKYLFQACYSEKIFYSLTQGVTESYRRLPADVFNNFVIPVPPLSEQTSIAKCLDAKCAEIDAVIDQKREQIAVLNDYKKSVIYEYVTGKKEVPAR